MQDYHGWLDGHVNAVLLLLLLGGLGRGFLLIAGLVLDDADAGDLHGRSVTSLELRSLDLHGEQVAVKAKKTRLTGGISLG